MSLPSAPGEPGDAGERPRSSPGEPGEAGWRLFSSRGRAFAYRPADTREARFRMGFLLERGGGVYEDLIWGGDLGILHVAWSRKTWLSVTARGVLSARFQLGSPSFDLQNTDFIGGVATGLAHGPWAFELLLFHQSSHLGDEILDRQEVERIDYGYEAARLLAARSWGRLRLYLGGTATLHSYPVQRQGDVALQLGGEWGFALWRVPGFVAAQGETRNLEAERLVVQLGAELGRLEPGEELRSRRPGRQRLFVELYRGSSAMGQFYDIQESYVLGGMSYLFR